MNFREFQATGRGVPDLRDDDAVAPQLADSDTPLGGRVYLDGLFIERGEGGEYCLTIGNRSEIGKDLAVMERALYDFAITEGYVDGPSIEEELIEALRGLCDYVGGMDAPAGHPCRIANDLLGRLG